MKATLIAFGIALASYESSAQKVSEANVPENLKLVIQQKFGVTDVDWDREGEDYEASFEQIGKDVSVVLRVDGSIIEIEKNIKKEELPLAVQASLSRDYDGYIVKEAAVIEANGLTSYEAEIKKAKESFDLIFDEKGNLKKKVLKGTEKD